MAAAIPVVGPDGAQNPPGDDPGGGGTAPGGCCDTGRGAGTGALVLSTSVLVLLRRRGRYGSRNVVTRSE